MDIQPKRRYAIRVTRKGTSKQWVALVKASGLSSPPKTMKPLCAWCFNLRDLAPWCITLSVNGIPVEFRIDTGADVTVIPMSELRNIPESTLKPATKTLSDASCTTLEVKGQFTTCQGY